MNKLLIKNIITGVLALLVLGGGGYYLYQSRTIQQHTEKPTPIEDLIKESAREMVMPNPTPPASSTNSNASTDICVGEQTFSCYEDYYKGLVKNKGVTAAFDDLKVRYYQNSYIQSQCHPITHVIGGAATELYPKVGEAYSKGDSYCWSGYYHGVMEGIIGKISRNELASQIDNTCSDIPGKASYSFDYYNCVHGLGHGVMAISQNELFYSLELCDNLKGAWEQQSCHGGVFMENIIVDNKNHLTKYLKPEDPLYPCNAVKDSYKVTCYLMQTSYMLKVTNSDFSKVFELCSQVGNFANTCYQSLGRDASGRSISNVDATKATCNLGKNYDQQVNCYIGAVKDFISYHHSLDSGKQLCNALDDVDIKNVCLSVAEDYSKTL